jgi:hypothetical protein
MTRAGAGPRTQAKTRPRESRSRIQFTASRPSRKCARAGNLARERAILASSRERAADVRLMWRRAGFRRRRGQPEP